MAGADVAQAHGAEVPSLGTIGTRQCDLDQLIRNMPAKATPLVLGDDAGPCGDWRSRSLMKKADDGWVVAPSLLPPKAGDRVTTDRRDAVPWARLARSGDLTPVDGPTVDDEAMRDLTRAREETLSALQEATCRLTACVRRHDLRDPGRATWNPAHRRWLAEVVCPTPAQPIVFHEYVRAVTEHTARLQRLAQARQERVTSWRLRPVVAALQAWRGVPCTGAVTLGAERGALTRVGHPRELRKCLGLSPAAYATGERRRPGAIPTAGHRQARRALGEGAWASR
jgi:transposase